MKLLKITFAAVFALAFGNAYAFHSGGVADCEGCHTMHNSFEGAAIDSNLPQYTSGPYLLKGSDQSSACLNCHQQPDTAPTGYHISTKGVSWTSPGVDSPPVEMTPGGDFGWLKMTRIGNIRGAMVTWNGERQGHSVIAADYGFAADSIQKAAPGGTYPAANLACSSCHDPHGKYRRDAAGNISTTGLPIFNSGSYNSSKAPIAGVSAVGVYRLLAGVGYQPKSLTGSYAFANPSPDAVAPASYNRSEAAGQTHVAYGRNMSEWCANCHTAMLENSYTSGMKGLVHPAGDSAKLTAAIVANYNAYVSSGIMTNTNPVNAYSTLAPFELGTGDYTILQPLGVITDTLDQSASTSANVMCLSCHRAHASAFESMTRFYTGNEFMTIADSTNAAVYDPSTTSATINTAYSVTAQTNAYYGRPATVFGPYARDYCNKCHAKD